MHSTHFEKTAAPLTGWWRDLAVGLVILAVIIAAWTVLGYFPFAEVGR